MGRSQPPVHTELGLEVPGIPKLWEPSSAHTELGEDVLSQQGAKRKGLQNTGGNYLSMLAAVKSSLMMT